MLIDNQVSEDSKFNVQKLVWSTRSSCVVSKISFFLASQFGLQNPFQSTFGGKYDNNNLSKNKPGSNTTGACLLHQIIQ